VGHGGVNGRSAPFYTPKSLWFSTILRTHMSDVIDLGEYPDETDKVLVAIDQTTTYGYEYGFTTLRKIAETSGLTKGKVRYRVDELHKNGHLIREREDDWRQNAPAQIWLTDEAKSFVRNQMDYHEIVGSFPDEPTEEDFVELVEYIQALEDRIDDLEDKMRSVEDDIEKLMMYWFAFVNTG